MNLLRHLVCIALIPAVACASSGKNSGSAHAPLQQDEDVVRYRLLLRDNPVNPGDAFRCYGKCQEQSTPADYLSCLQECPGFEVTAGEVCAKTEVPPVAACLVVRKVQQTNKGADTGLVVLGVVGTFALVVTAASLCASSHSQCGYEEQYGYAPR
ncbi:MAG TPA: hypothetical protein VL137_06405 [Polyangiaceae bacterium]|nr:hypothetical protein [Polyangiaceae bacterium]